MKQKIILLIFIVFTFFMVGCSDDEGSKTPVLSAVVFSSPAGLYYTNFNLTLTSSNVDSAITYTTNGSIPSSTNGYAYSNVIPIFTGTEVKAFSSASGFDDSDVVTATYVMQTASPSFSLPTGSYDTNISVAISCLSSGATVKYTTNGTFPSASNGYVYSSAISLSAGTTVKAFAFKNGYVDSLVATVIYAMETASPVFSTSSGVYESSKVISLSCPTAASIIRFTTNGSVPTSSSGEIYSSEITLSKSATVKAISYSSGLDDSAVVSKFYSIYTNELRGATYLGAGNGVKFSVYAPNAATVSVAGNFNSWSAVANPMIKNADDVWEVTVSSANPGDMYKFVIGSDWIPDPYARAFNEDDNFNSLIMDNSTYSWNDGSWTRPPRSQLVIYEMQIEDFTRNDSEATSGANYSGVIDKIQYLKDLGVNAVEIMPIQEWPGGWYSWGYNNSGYFSPESSLSGDISDGSAYNDFKALVDALHQAGIAVILDVVYNHTSNDQNLLWMIDQTIYFSGSTPWGNRLALELPAAYKFVYDNMRYWMDEFHVDGFRLDSTENIDTASVINVVNDLYTAGYSDNYYIFEEFNGDNNADIRTYNTSKGTQVISSWGTGYKNAMWSLVEYGSSGDMGKITYFSHDDGWNNPNEVINYFSSHDEGTLTGNKSASKQTVKTAAAHLLTSLGIPMIWMGDEVARVHYGNNTPAAWGEGANIAEVNNVMDWDALRSSNQDLFDYYAALIKLRIDHPVLRLTDNDPETAGHFAWNTDWPDTSFIGYTYKNIVGDNNFVVLINYNKTSAKTFATTFPNTGVWYQMCDGQSAYRYSPGTGAVDISTATTSITIPANTAYIYMSEFVN